MARLISWGGVGLKKVEVVGDAIAATAVAAVVIVGSPTNALSDFGITVATSAASRNGILKRNS